MSAINLSLSCSVLGAVEGDIRRDATVAATELVMPSVVNIATETIRESHEWYDEVRRQYYGVPLPRSKSFSLGSGVIIDEEGYLLTNYHVVSTANRIQVKLWDGREYDAEALIATSTSDVALLRIKAAPGERFKAIKFAHDDDLLLGETVLALGNPFGLGSSVTKGILSSKNRRPSIGNEPLNLEDWLETDAAINPGNSGGPLVNLRGELIGLNVAVYRQEQGMGLGFSIPVKHVSAALAHFFRPESADSLWFGAQLKASPGPMMVTTVGPGSPAARAGIRENDQIVQVNGQVPIGVIAFNRLLKKSSEADNHLIVARDGERLSVTVRLLPLGDLIWQKLGLKLRQLDAAKANSAGWSQGPAMAVEEVDKNGPGAMAGLKPGILLARVEGQPAREPRAIADPLVDLKQGEPVHFLVVARKAVAPGFVEAREFALDVNVR